MTTRAHIAANYQIGDPDEEMIEIPDQTCECGKRLVPLLGKIVRDRYVPDVWVPGNYEHVYRPDYPHIPKPIGEWNGNED